MIQVSDIAEPGAGTAGPEGFYDSVELLYDDVVTLAGGM
jgi:hypothetical protein